MAKVTNAFSTYQAKGNREDLSDIIYNIDPADTPLMTLLGVRNVKSRTFDWQTEKLPAVDATNAQIEGFELIRKPATPTVRINNVVQISERDATVTNTQEEVDAAGKNGEMSHQVALNGKALKRDMEVIISGVQPRSDGDDATARKTRAFEHWITTNVSGGVGYTNPIDAYSPVTDGTQRPFDEGMLGDALQAAYQSGAEPTTLVMAPFQKRRFSNFEGRKLSRVAVKPGDILASADYYLSDFGDMKALPSRWVRPRTVLGIDPAYASVAYFRKFRRIDIATIGDAETKMIVSEYGLEMKNEAAHLKIADLATSGSVAAIP